ncbi:site-specific integrase [Pseudarthrobacter sp. S9]|uniref:site-specific integrase n=1 Tax=Pseudarthrobacter sp. S9 TaxID=3418421 RepID=UPI003D092669
MQVNEEHIPRVLSELVVPPSGALKTTGNPFEPYRLVDGAGETVGPAAAFFAELVARGRPATTLRSYGMDLLRWFRFLSALEMVWDQATQVEARDFCRWLQVALKPVRPHWRYPDGGGPDSDVTPGAERRIQGGARPRTATGMPR